MTTGRWTDEALERDLRQLAAEVAWPAAADRVPDLAARVRVRLQDAAPAAAPRPRPPASRRLALALALAAALLVAAAAGAAILGLPGLRLTLGDPGVAPTVRPVPSASAGPSRSPGADLGLGTAVSLEDAERRTGRPLPRDPTLGPPDAVYIDLERARQVALVWTARADLPETALEGIGLILMAFDGVVEDDGYQKLIGSGSTVERVRVAGQPGYWIGGDPHVFFYTASDGSVVHDERRWVGDALVWSDGTTTWRIESGLGRDETIRLAERLGGG